MSNAGPDPVDYRLHLDIDISAWDEWRASLVAKAIEEALGKLDGGYTGLEGISIEYIELESLAADHDAPLLCWCGDEATYALAGSDASPRQPVCTEHVNESDALGLRQFGATPEEAKNHPRVRDYLGLV